VFVLQSQWQNERFAELRKLTDDHVIDLATADQERLFCLESEYKLIDEIRDILDELNIILYVYRDQFRILSAMKGAQTQYELYLANKTDEKGNRKCSEKDELCQYGKVEIDSDPRGWFTRTTEYIKEHLEEVQDMLDEAERIYNSVGETQISKPVLLLRLSNTCS
jgi:hypothetical protein